MNRLSLNRYLTQIMFNYVRDDFGLSENLLYLNEDELSIPLYLMGGGLSEFGF